MNKKSNEFIIKHNNFWSLISKDEQDIILKEVAEFGDLEIMDMFEYNHATKSSTGDAFIKYIYIGKKEDSDYTIKYYYKCIFNPKTKVCSTVDGGAGLITVLIKKNSSKLVFTNI